MNRQRNKIKLILDINSKLSDVSSRTTRLLHARLLVLAEMHDGTPCKAVSQEWDKRNLSPPLRFKEGASTLSQIASFTPRSNHRASLSRILTSGGKVLCPLATLWVYTGESLVDIPLELGLRCWFNRCFRAV